MSGFENWKNTVESERKTLNNQHHFLKENKELVVNIEEDLDGQINIGIEADIKIRNGSGKVPSNMSLSLRDFHNYYGLVADVYYDITDHNEITVEGNIVTIEKLNFEYAFRYAESGSSSSSLIVDSDINVFNWGLEGRISNYDEIEKDYNNNLVFTSSNGEEYSAIDLETSGDYFGFEFNNMEYIYLNQSRYVNNSASNNSSVYYADYEFLPVNKFNELINYVWVGISAVGLIVGIILITFTYKKQKINIK